MNLLLDTHTLIWFAEQNQQLSEKAKRKIESSDNKVFVSIASYWEISIKLGLKKIKLNYPLKKLMNEAEKHNIQLLPIEPNHILALESLPLHHRDPFDRIILAQAITENFKLVSKDEHFALYKVKRVW